MTTRKYTNPAVVRHESTSLASIQSAVSGRLKIADELIDLGVRPFWKSISTLDRMIVYAAMEVMQCACCHCTVQVVLIVA